MDKETRERKIQEFIEWRKDKTEEEIGLYKNINPENLPDSFFNETENIPNSKKVIHYKTWKPSPELVEEYKEELEAYHKWARRSRGEKI